MDSLRHLQTALIPILLKFNRGEHGDDTSDGSGHTWHEFFETPVNATPILL